MLEPLVLKGTRAVLRRGQEGNFLTLSDYPKKSGGTKITTNTKFQKSTTLYAHWKTGDFSIVGIWKPIKKSKTYSEYIEFKQDGTFFYESKFSGEYMAGCIQQQKGTYSIKYLYPLEGYTEDHDVVKVMKMKSNNEERFYGYDLANDDNGNTKRVWYWEPWRKQTVFPVDFSEYAIKNGRGVLANSEDWENGWVKAVTIS